MDSPKEGAIEVRNEFVRFGEFFERVLLSCGVFPVPGNDKKSLVGGVCFKFPDIRPLTESKSNDFPIEVCVIDHSQIIEVAGPAFS